MQREEANCTARGRRREPVDDVTDLGLESHVEHAVRLVQREEGDPLQGDPPSLQHVIETAGGRHENVAAALDLAHLVAERRAAVAVTGRHRRSETTHACGLTLRELGAEGEAHATQMERPVSKENFRPSSKIWVASSRVGAKTRPEIAIRARRPVSCGGGGPCLSRW